VVFTGVYPGLLYEGMIHHQFFSVDVPYVWRGMVMLLINLHPLLSLQVHWYPECLEAVRPRYKRAAAERRTRSGQWELLHCSVVYAVASTFCRAAKTPSCVCGNCRLVDVWSRTPELDWTAYRNTAPRPSSTTPKTTVVPNRLEWYLYIIEGVFSSSILGRCWLDDGKGIRPVKSWVLDCWFLGSDDFTGALHVL